MGSMALGAADLLTACGSLSSAPSPVTSGANEVESFEVLGDWTAGGAGAVLGSDTVNVRRGSHSLKVAANRGNYATATKSVDLDLSSHAPMGMWLYVWDASFAGGGAVYSEEPTLGAISIYFSSSSSFDTCYKAFVSGGSLAPGWNFLKFADADWANFGSESWSNRMVRMRLRIDPQSGKSAAVSFDSLQRNVFGKGAVAIFFDDGWERAKDEGFDYMRRYDMPGNIACVPSFTGNTGAGYLTLADLHVMNAAGWDIANHTWDHRNLATLTQAQVQEEVGQARVWLRAHGLRRAADHVVYPDGHFSLTAIAGLKAAGMLTGRSCVDREAATPFITPYYYPAYTVSPTDSLATVKGHVDDAVERQALYILVFHQIVGLPARGATPQWSRANFRALIDYIVARKVRVVRISDVA